QPESKRHGDIAFQSVEKQGRNRKSLRSRARNIGRTNVSAAGVTNILPAKNAHQQIAEGYRAQQIGNHDGNEQKFRQSHALGSETIPGESATALYNAHPPGTACFRRDRTRARSLYRTPVAQGFRVWPAPAAGLARSVLQGPDADVRCQHAPASNVD